ncbi:MAG TPA: hypothetical protein VL574_12710 [Stellaceae bacterium]|jgi:hypothetical protein|nr:hypothetical protein [Stellaceae bacterium]
MSILSYFTHISDDYIPWIFTALYLWTFVILCLKLYQPSFRAYSFYFLLAAPHLLFSLLALARLLQNRLKDVQSWQVMDIIVRNAMGWIIVVPALPIGIVLFTLGVYEYGKDFPVIRAENTQRARIRYGILFGVLTICEIWTQSLNVTPPT